MGIDQEIARDVVDYCFCDTNQSVLMLGTRKYHISGVYKGIVNALEQHNAGHLIERAWVHKNEVLYRSEICFINGSRFRGYVPLKERDHPVLCGENAHIIVTVDTENILHEDLLSLQALKNCYPGVTWKEYSWT